MVVASPPTESLETLATVTTEIQSPHIPPVERLSPLTRFWACMEDPLDIHHMSSKIKKQIITLVTFVSTVGFFLDGQLLGGGTWNKDNPQQHEYAGVLILATVQPIKFVLLYTVCIILSAIVIFLLDLFAIGLPVCIKLSMKIVLCCFMIFFEVYVMSLSHGTKAFRSVLLISPLPFIPFASRNVAAFKIWLCEPMDQHAVEDPDIEDQADDIESGNAEDC